jgi:YidC/Oxa1 family membrane protein insertase
MSRLRLAACIALLLASPAARAAAADSVEARGESLRVEIALDGASPVRWEACYPSCDATVDRAVFGTRLDPPLVRIAAPGDPGLGERIDALRYRVLRREEEGTSVLDFVSAPLADDVVVRKTWRISKRGYEASLEVSLQGEGGERFLRAHPLELLLQTGRSFEPEPAWGFAALSEALTAVQISSGSVRDLGEQPGPEPLAAGGWTGVRSRFWALLVRSDASGTVDSPRAASVSLQLAPALAQRFQFYAGPIERHLLRATDPALGALLFAHLWFWLRWLALGLLILLGALRDLVGNAGVAILLLAVCVKLLMRPLTATAERWQRQVNEKRTQLQPGIDEIKASSSGSERSRRLFDLHREHGVSLFYGLKSLLAVLIQIPVFIAAYHTLDEDFALSHVGFLWIANLVEPDRLVLLPFAIPFFGDALNLLPFLMSALTVLSSRLHDDGTLAPQLLRSQRRGLYVMALAFFVLFYSFPAGMVLYWTSNNLVALARDEISRWIPRRRDSTWRLGFDALRR